MTQSTQNHSPLAGVRGQLLSQHYLTTQLVNRDDWKTAAADERALEIEKLFDKVKPQLSKNGPSSKGSNEDAVRDLFLNRVFDVLGLPWSPSVRHFDKELDYALFENQEALARAQILISAGKELEALKASCAIVEAERWGKEFDEKPKKSDLRDPIFQIEFYLQNAHRSGGPRWGILTNGHTWRLYCGDSDPLRHDYLEIELPTKPSLFAQQERDAFKLLVYFFSVEGLRNGGKLDKIYDDATRNAAAITAELRRQAFGAVELIASAIMRASPSASPHLAYEAALIQLFRLLFILKAEADGLLQQHTLSDEIAGRIIKKNADSIGGGDWGEGKSFWHELHDIFEAIANEYNGHLFEGKPPTSSPAAAEGVDYFDPARTLLESVTLPNQAVANAIDRLLRVYQPTDEKKLHPVRVDYSTLRVRELGTIYEGLLEWRLEPVSDAALRVGSVTLLGDKHITRKVERGDFALASDQADRKATGSYYTPHYVVQFICERTLQAILEELEEKSDNDPALIISRILDLRLLDPAMGSGHFLVFAVEYLAAYVYVQLGKLREQSKSNGKPKKGIKNATPPLALDASIEFIRARIAERCIYGVDVNPLAVELAKLSLWIATASRGVPLSFLNHHLRCGDSLLGVSSRELHHDLFAQKLAQQMALAVGHIRLINELYTETLQDVGKKEEELRIAREHLRRFRLTYDCQLAPLFGLHIAGQFHAWLDGIGDPVPDPLPAWLRGVEDVASEFRFFHWELEFPEVWRDRFGHLLDASGESGKRAPGFDLILGNPPFVTARNPRAREAYRAIFHTAHMKFSLVVPFFERVFSLLRPGGALGLIVSNAFAKREFGKPLVEKFLPTQRLAYIVDCSGLSFPGHGTPTCIVFATNTPPEPKSQVCVAVGLKGDLKTPPEDTALWAALRTHFTDPGFKDPWVSVDLRDRAQLSKHPWNFNVGNEPTKVTVENGSDARLRDLLDDDISFDCVTAANDLYFVPPHLVRRFRIPSQFLKPLVVGEEVRDYQFRSGWLALWPYDRNSQPKLSTEVEAFLAPFRSHLEVRSQFHKTQIEAGLKWFEYREYHREGLGVRIAYPQITTHNHFVLSNTPRVFNEKTPLLHLSVAAEDLDSYYVIMSILNSSTALFWMKQVCFNKGAGEAEEKDRYEFQASKLHLTPIPMSRFSSGTLRDRAIGLSRQCSAMGIQGLQLVSERLFEKSGEAYDGWSRALPGYTSPPSLLAEPFLSIDELVRNKRKAREERECVRKKMISLQEEMDWLVYVGYGLLHPNHEAVGLDIMNSEHPWQTELGQRPFELLTIHAGPASNWEDQRKKICMARMNAILTNEHIARIEQPVYKRRWVPMDYEKEFAKAFKSWLREKAEFLLEHSLDGGPVSLEDWAAGLWKDPRIRAAAAVYSDSSVDNAKKFAPLLKEAVEDESVPDDETAFKLQHKQLRGKFNLPRERFRSLTSRPGCYVWSGKHD